MADNETKKTNEGAGAESGQWAPAKDADDTDVGSNYGSGNSSAYGVGGSDYGGGGTSDGLPATAPADVADETKGDKEWA